MKELTRSEKTKENVQDTLEFLKSYSRESGGTKPTIREIMEELDFSSSSVVYRYLDKLEDQRKIKRRPRMDEVSRESYISIVGERYEC